MSNIGFKENLMNEFKSDRTCLPDSDIIDAVVAFANTDGGDLFWASKMMEKLPDYTTSIKISHNLQHSLPTEQFRRFLFVQKF